MNRLLKYILLILLIFFLFAPIVQKTFVVIPETKLLGAFNNSSDTVFTFSGWFDRRFQDQKEKYLNENFGFRNWLVKIKNQVNLSFFGEINVYDVFLGKRNYLFSNLFYRGFSGLSYKGRHYTDSIADRLLSLNDQLTRHNKKLLICITPCKESFYTEYLPDSCLNNIRSESYYKDYVSAFRNKKIPLLDFNEQFLTLKSKSKFPLFTQGAVHWTTYGAYLALDTLLKRISVEIDKKVNQIEIVSIEESDTARFDDDDISRAMNLLQNVNSEKLGYPAVRYRFHQDSCYRPKVMLIGDSFYYGLNNTWIPPSVFSRESYFLYYFQRAISYDNKPDCSVVELDLSKELANTDILVLFFSIGTLNDFPYGADSIISYIK